MTTTEKPRRTFQGTIQGIADKQGSRGPYFVLEFPPPPKMKYPEAFTAWDMALKGEFKVGDNVLLTLEQGNQRKENPQYENDWYWNIIAIAKAEPVAPAKTPEVAKETRVMGIPGEREAAIALAHQENMAAHEEQMRATAYLGAVIIGAIRAYLSKDPAPISTEAIKRTANDLWAEIKAQ